ncbi:hypothetical protein BHM03_00008464 [Ensete ventricosum]|nr:hypothetical protein BHM03_00008464 [Ensete ventricosum]
MGCTYRSIRLSVCEPPTIRQFRQKSTVGGRLREKSTVGGRLREKKGRRRRGKEEKKKKRKGEYLFPRAILVGTPSLPVGRQRPRNAKCFAQKELNFTPTWSKSLIVLVASGIVSSSPLSLSLAPLSRKVPGLYPLALSWYLEFASAFFTFLAPFTTNALLSLHESKGSMRKSCLCGTIVLLSPWHYYPLPRICISFFAIGRSASMVLWHSSKFTSILIDA